MKNEVKIRIINGCIRGKSIEELVQSCKVSEAEINKWLRTVQAAVREALTTESVDNLIELAIGTLVGGGMDEGKASSLVREAASMFGTNTFTDADLVNTAQILFSKESSMAIKDGSTAMTPEASAKIDEAKRSQNATVVRSNEDMGVYTF